MFKRHAAVAAAVSLLLLLAGCSRGPEGVVKGFYRSLDKGDIETAAGHLSSQIVAVFGKEKLGAALGEFAARMEQCGGLEAVEVALSGEGDTRHGNSKVSFKGDCIDQDNTVVVVKEEGDWKLGLGK